MWVFVAVSLLEASLTLKLRPHLSVGSIQFDVLSCTSGNWFVVMWYGDGCSEAGNSVLHMQWLNPLFSSCYTEKVKWSRLSVAAAFIINLLVYRHVSCVFFTAAGWSGFFLSDHETDLLLIMIINHQDWSVTSCDCTTVGKLLHFFHTSCTLCLFIYWTPGVCVLSLMDLLYCMHVIIFYVYMYSELTVYYSVCVCVSSLIEVFLLSDCHGFQMPDYQPTLPFLVWWVIRYRADCETQHV